MRTRSALSLIALTALAACGSVPTQRFVFDAIDVKGEPRPCLVIVNDDWATAAEKNQVVNVAENDQFAIDIPFPTKQVMVKLAPLVVENGKVVKMPKRSRETSELSDYLEEARELRLRDPERQLFILRRKNGGS